jgi:hypothetical protein
MAKSYVAFDSRSGRILSVHHGGVDAEHAREHARYHAEISDDHLAVVVVPSEAVEGGKRYKVDVARGVLVAVADDEDGVGFGFGATAEARIAGGG